MSSQWQFNEKCCLSVKVKSDVVFLSESSNGSYDDLSGDQISSVGLDEDMVIC